MSDRICYFCHYMTYDRSNTEEHLRCHTKEKPFPCMERNCSWSFARQSYLINHNRKLHKIFNLKERQKSIHKCYFCSREWNSSSDLAVHMLCRTRERPYKCPFTKCKKFSRGTGAPKLAISTLLYAIIIPI